MDWYPWYYTIYEQDTMHLTPYQDGCYRRLIDHYMKTRVSLPDNDSALARIVGDSEANWVAMASAMVRPFFKAQKGRLFLKRCEDILNYQDKKSKKLSESGKKGAQKRWNENNDLNSHPIAHPIATLKPTDSTGQYNTIQDNKEEGYIGDNKLTSSKETSEIENLKNENHDNEIPTFENGWKNSPYKFNGKVMRITDKDFDEMRAKYAGTTEQFWDWMDARDDWLNTLPPEKRKNWFITTHKALEKLK